ncbi:MAG: NAD(P)H-dependent oxidoreductase [Spirochaetaceae bacterium]|jgi:multimeric flavodoxin WrbA|nr:NAD(P)H-dependent oxidoreductase [Spirochaetaceae bacterium]
MPALILTGSPREDGVTARLAACFERVWGEARGGPVCRFDAYALAARPCSHCGFCKTVSGCVHSDLDGFDAALRQADFVAVAAPVYMLGFPAPLKAILDRSQRYFEEKFCRGIALPTGGPRGALLLTACGSGGADCTSMLERQLGMALPLWGARLVRTIAARNTDRIPPDFAACEAEMRAVFQASAQGA